MVATAVDRLSQRADSLTATPSRLSLPEAWHLLSLDAPTIAALWAWFFARAMHIRLPWHAPLLLALGTWLIYVADRILDGYRRSSSAPLRLRHQFHAEHRTAFLTATSIGGVALIWLIVNRMTPAARSEDSVLFLAALLYFFLVHTSGETRGWLPKELAVGVVFAAATAVPAWSRLEMGRLVLLPAVAIFVALCWLNCVAIERWESLKDNLCEPAPPPAKLHVTTSWPAEHFAMASGILAALSAILAGLAAAASQVTASIYAAIGAAALCFVLIDRNRGKFTGMQLRIAADAALLTPLLFLPVLL